MRDVSLFLSLEHSEAIVWLLISPDFSILVSREIGKLEGAERKRWLVSKAVKTHLSSSPSYMGMVHDVLKQLQW